MEGRNNPPKTVTHRLQYHIDRVLVEIMASISQVSQEDLLHTSLAADLGLYDRKETEQENDGKKASTIPRSIGPKEVNATLHFYLPKGRS